MDQSTVGLLHTPCFTRSRHLKRVDQFEGVLSGPEDLVPPIPPGVQLHQRFHLLNPSGNLFVVQILYFVHKIRKIQIANFNQLHVVV